jgi:hypothetical protein
MLATLRDYTPLRYRVHATTRDSLPLGQWKAQGWRTWSHYRCAKSLEEPRCTYVKEGK